MSLVHRYRLCFFGVLSASIFLSWGALADEKGKIAGTIRDKRTHEPLVGANVVVVGTNLGAVTDDKGYYYVLRITPGKYDVRISLIGYKTLNVRDVIVKTDLTTEVSMQLEETTIQAAEVTVFAEQKMVQKDITSTRRTVSRETMKETPGIESATDIFKLQGGSVLSSVPQAIRLADGSQLQVRDESLKDIHVRGGRGGEILYLIDGMPVTHPIYGGRSVIDLNVSDVENVELLTGAFSAEYGQAQSGVVNVTTRSGGDSLSGGAEYKTDRYGGLGESYNTDYATLYLGGPEPITQSLLPMIGLDVPGKVSFFFSANGNLTNTAYNNRKNRSRITLFGLKLQGRQENTQNVNGKLNWDLAGSRLTLSYHGSTNEWSFFGNERDWLWRDYPDRIPDYRRDNRAVNARFNHVISQSTYISVNLGYLGVDYRGSWNGKNPSDYWVQDSSGRYVSTISAPQVAPGTGFFDDRGYENIWRDDHTDTYTFKADFTSQVLSRHMMKAGLELQWNNISYIDIQDGGYKLSRLGQGIDSLPPPGPFPQFGQNRWVFRVKPVIGSAYIQDKIELDNLILNAGFRIDAFSLGNTVMSQTWKSVWERATGENADWKEIIYKVSPRLGVSFPISEYTVVFFSYGHFNQLPELQYYYRDPYSGRFTGNPKLDYEQTILYEFGLTHQLSQHYAIDVKSYAKDISKQVGTTTVHGPEGIPVELYDNKGYARARGLEFQLTKGFADFTSGKLTYTIQWANGYSSSAFDDYARSITNFPYPIRERALGWDVRHQVIFEGTVSSPRDRPLELLGVELPTDWNLTVLYSYSTGLPYTPGPATINPVEAQKQENTAYGPSHSSTDLKFEKGFSVGAVRLALTIDVFNLFNERNIQMSYGFNTWTGKPFVYGDVERPQPNFYDYYTMISLMDPRQYSGGRMAKLGIKVDF